MAVIFTRNRKGIESGLALHIDEIDLLAKDNNEISSERPIKGDQACRC